jgi:hypothetical protein
MDKWRKGERKAIGYRPKAKGVNNKGLSRLSLFRLIGTAEGSWVVDGPDWDEHGYRVTTRCDSCGVTLSPALKGRATYICCSAAGGLRGMQNEE